MNWTEHKDDLLRRYPGLDDAVMAERIGTTATAVAARRLSLGIRRNAKPNKFLGWTAERIAELRKFDGEGHSASQIAKLLGGNLSRNAVIGKLHRLGIANPQRAPGRMMASKINQHGLKPPTPIPAARTFQHGDGCSFDAAPKAPRPPTTAGATPQSKNLRIADEGFSGCRWPTFGDGADTLFCCAAAEGQTYCPTHQARARGAPGPRAIKTTQELERSVRRYA